MNPIILQHIFYVGSQNIWQQLDIILSIWNATHSFAAFCKMICWTETDTYFERKRWIFIWLKLSICLGFLCWCKQTLPERMYCWIFLSFRGRLKLRPGCACLFRFRCLLLNGRAADCGSGLRQAGKAAKTQRRPELRQATGSTKNSSACVYVCVTECICVRGDCVCVCVWLCLSVYVLPRLL